MRDNFNNIIGADKKFRDKKKQQLKTKIIKFVNDVDTQNYKFNRDIEKLRGLCLHINTLQSLLYKRQETSKIENTYNLLLKKLN